MAAIANRLLEEVYHRVAADQDHLILIFFPSLETPKKPQRNPCWARLVPLLSPLDTRVLQFQGGRTREQSLSDLFASSKTLLYELFTVHLHLDDVCPPIVLIGERSGGLLLKEVIALALDDLNRWQSGLNHICGFVFLATPHVRDPRDFEDNGPLRSPAKNGAAAGGLFSSAETAWLILSAESFVTTLKQIDSHPQVLSGYEQEPHRKLHWPPKLSSRGTGTIVDKQCARLGVADEDLILMDVGAHQVLDESCQCAFRSSVKLHIRSAVQRYMDWDRHNKRPSPIILTPSSSQGSVVGVDLLNSGSNAASPLSSRPGSGSSAPSGSLAQGPRRIKLPFVYPPDALNQKATYFQPRMDVSLAMDDALLPSRNPTNASNLLTVVLTGLGGLGKTELASDFATRNRDEFNVIAFVVADSRDRLSQQFSRISARLRLTETRGNPDPEGDREALKSWFSNPVVFPDHATLAPTRSNLDDGTKVKWLLIFDNADDPRVLDDFWPSSGFGSVLLTSRDPAAKARHCPTSQSMLLEGLPDNDAIALLRKVANSDKDADDDSAARSIARRLAGLPLAIVQIGSIILRQQLSLAAFARDYAESSKYHTLYDNRGNTNRYEHSLASVWAFDSLEAEDKIAHTLVSVLSMLDPACVPEALLLLSFNDNSLKYYPRNKVEYNATLSKLIERSMVHKDRDSGSITIHRLVSDVARARLAKRPRDLFMAFEAAWKAVASAFPGRSEALNTAGSVSRWQRCSEVYPHVVQLGHVALEMSDIQQAGTIQLEFVDLIYQAAWWQCERREAQEARFLTEVGSTILAQMPQQKPDKPGCRTPLGKRETAMWACKIIIAMTMGDHKTAFQYSQRRFEVSEAEYQATGNLTGFQTATCTTLGVSYAMNRVHDQAIAYLERSIQLRELMPEFQKDWLYSPYYALGTLYHRMGRLDEATKLLTEAIADHEQALGPNDRVSDRTGSLYYALGKVRASQGLLDEAYGLHHRASLQCRGTVGDSALSTLKCHQKLAEHYERYGDYSTASTYLQAILNLCGEREDRKREVCQALYTQSRILRQQGHRAEAERDLDKAVSIYNALRPGNEKNRNELIWDDVQNLIYFDFF
ncbi:hypothetical protein LTR56_002332 [Elasticomyces elasticus]|nr:hypothetical protein LTR56_002332 [Elasticomyces elasticus]KAK3665896.1 hypothetical protein LTR22_003215 [Elasticomyces elasticus]KAK4929368.1 hypothetical protein LTR49_003972 [Elasticomyces elasticus]KAK5764657.1 hypothetical protein LTS12_005158 [Elasticomyces elasticus]